MTRMSKREQRLLVFVGGLAILITWVYAVYIVKPLKREADDLGRQIHAAREQLRLLEIAVSSEAAVEEKSRRLEASVQSLRGSLTPEAELPSVIGLLTELASQTQVKVQAIFPQRPAEQMEPRAPDAGQGSMSTSLPAVYYKEIPIQLDALAGYHQLGTFLNLVETADKPMRLLSLRISPNPKEPRWHRVKLLVQSYVAVPEPSPVGALP